MRAAGPPDPAEVCSVRQCSALKVLPGQGSAGWARDVRSRVVTWSNEIWMFRERSIE
jgi:hypothetical protein